jgi:hypothetical protein
MTDEQIDFELKRSKKIESPSEKPEGLGRPKMED